MNGEKSCAFWNVSLLSIYTLHRACINGIERSSRVREVRYICFVSRVRVEVDLGKIGNLLCNINNGGSQESW